MRKAQDCLGKVRFVRKRNTTTPICAWTPTGGWSMWLWESLSRICIQIVTEHSNESWKFTLFLKMSGNANAMVRLRFQLMVSKNIYCSGFKETNFCSLFLPTTTAHATVVQFRSCQYLSTNIFWLFGYFFKGGWIFFLCNTTLFFPALMLKDIKSQEVIAISYEQIMNILKFCALVKTEWSRMV